LKGLVLNLPGFWPIYSSIIVIIDVNVIISAIVITVRRTKANWYSEKIGTVLGQPEIHLLLGMIQLFVESIYSGFCWNYDTIFVHSKALDDVVIFQETTLGIQFELVAILSDTISWFSIKTRIVSTISRSSVCSKIRHINFAQ
jgi:hypothetical protein